MNSVTHIAFKAEKLRQTKWRELLARFAFGGLATAVAGVIGNVYGPGLGGLFLAFPAIFPASITLVEKRSGRQAAIHEARGAVLGSLGLAIFALAVWFLSPQLSAVLVLALGALLWLAAGTALWVFAPPGKEPD